MAPSSRTSWQCEILIGTRYVSVLGSAEWGEDDTVVGSILSGPFSSPALPVSQMAVSCQLSPAHDRTGPLCPAQRARWALLLALSIPSPPQEMGFQSNILQGQRRRACLGFPIPRSTGMCRNTQLYIKHMYLQLKCGAVRGRAVEHTTSRPPQA